MSAIDIFTITSLVLIALAMIAAAMFCARELRRIDGDVDRAGEEVKDA